MKYIIALLLILLNISSASAEFNDILGLAGLPRDAVNHEFKQINSYSFMEPDSAIVQVWHRASYGTVVQETYYMQGGSVMTTRYFCTNSFLKTTCNVYVSNGVTSNETNFSFISFGLTGGTDIDTSIINDKNGTIWFGIGLQGFDHGALGLTNLVFDEYALITFDALQSAPITSMKGSSSSLIDINVQTLAIDAYSDYVNGLISQEERQALGAESIAQIQNIVLGVVGVINLLFANPILVIAYIETFILLFSLRSRNVSQWWKKMLGLHGTILEFIFSNAQAIVGALVVVTTIRIISGLLGL